MAARTDSTACALEPLRPSAPLLPFHALPDGQVYSELVASLLISANLFWPWVGYQQSFAALVLHDESPADHNMGVVLA